MVRYFPAAPNLTFSEVIAGCLFYNIIPLIVSFITYFFIYYGIEKLFGGKSTFSIFVTAFILTVTTPIVYFVSGGFEPFKYKASIWALILSFAVSIVTYYWLNKGNRHKSLLAI
jgi:hypothetical protein